MFKERMTIIKKNTHPDGSNESLAYEQGWCDGYDSNEEAWVAQVLPIVGELEEHIRYDWERNDCLQVKKIKMIFDVFWQYSPEHDWLEPLIKDAVEAYKEHQWDDLTKGELEDLRYMAKRFGIPMTNTWRVDITYSTSIDVEADSKDDAIEKATNQFIDENYIEGIAGEAEYEAQEEL